MPTNKLSQSISRIPHAQLDTQTCSLLGPFSILIQAIMALIILSSLLYKRHGEKPKRKYHIWAADVSKQVIGQAFVHMLNIFISDSMASLPSKGNPCALYFMNIFIDTTIGVFVLFLALSLMTTLISKVLRKSPASLGLASGNYPRPFLMSWAKQLSIYFLGLLILKLFVISLFWLGGEALIKFGNGVIEGISHDPKIQILIVVMVGPTILNVLQFLLIDSFIKHKHKPTFNSEQVESENDQRFLNDESDLDSDGQDLEEEDDDDDSSKSNGLLNHGDEDRTVSKKKNFQKRNSTRHQGARLSNPTNLHGTLSAVVANVHDPHSYPPKIPEAETRERNLSSNCPIDLASTLQTRRRNQVSPQLIKTTDKLDDSNQITSLTFVRQRDNQESLVKNSHTPQNYMNGSDHSDGHIHHSIIHINAHSSDSISPTHLKTGLSLRNHDSSLHLSSPLLHSHRIEPHNQSVF